MQRPFTQVFSFIILGLLLLASCSHPTNSPPAHDFVPGLNASYQGAEANQWQSVNQIDSQIAFNWGSFSPIEGMFPGNFKATWQGYLLAPESGTYQFSLEGSGKVRLQLGNQELSTFSQTLTMTLEAGRQYPIYLEYQRGSTSEAALILRWYLPSDPSRNEEAAVVPGTAFQTEALKSSSQTITPQVISLNTNLLKNPGFESGSGSWVRYAGNRSLVSPAHDNSNNALGLNNFAWVQQDLPKVKILAGEKYTFSVWVQARGTNTTCTAGLAVGGAQTKRYPLKFSSKTSGLWQLQSVSVTLPSKVDWLAVYLTSPKVSLPDPNLKPCNYDDVSVIAGDLSYPSPPPPTTQNWLQNGDFSYGLQAWNFASGAAELKNDSLAIDPPYALVHGWMQQNLDISLVQPRLADKVFVSGLASVQQTGQSCQFGLVVGTSAGQTQELYSQTLSTTYIDYFGSQGKGDIVLPSNLTWAAFYVAAPTGGCQVDDFTISLAPSSGWLALPEGSIGNMIPYDLALDPNDRPVLVGTETPERGISSFATQGIQVYRWETTEPVKLANLTDTRPSSIVVFSGAELIFDGLQPVVAYGEDFKDPNGNISSSQVVVKRFDGSSWTQLGGNLASRSGPVSLVKASGAYLLAYNNSQGGISVQRWTGSQWQLEHSIKAVNSDFAANPVLRLNKANNPVLLYGLGAKSYFIQGNLRATGSTWLALSSQAGYPKTFEIDSQDRFILASSPSAGSQLELSLVGTKLLGGSFNPNLFSLSLLNDQPVVGSVLSYSRWTGSSFEMLPALTGLGTHANLLSSRSDGTLFTAITLVGSGMSPISKPLLFSLKP